MKEIKSVAELVADECYLVYSLSAPYNKALEYYRFGEPSIIDWCVTSEQHRVFGPVPTLDQIEAMCDEKN